MTKLYYSSFYSVYESYITILAFIGSIQMHIYPLNCFIISELWRIRDYFSLPILYPQQAAVIVNSSRSHFEGLIKADEDA